MLFMSFEILFMKKSCRMQPTGQRTEIANWFICTYICKMYDAMVRKGQGSIRRLFVIIYIYLFIYLCFK
jgi:hypothetical protein